MSAHPHIAGLILAGGLSRRMGGSDKATIEAGGMSLAGRAAARLAPQVDEVLLSANGDPERFARLGLTVLADVVEGHPGPLAGVLTGLEWLRVHRPAIRHMATVPADSPLFPTDLVSRLDACAAPVAVAESGGRVHPVFALWNVALAPTLRRALVEQDERRVGKVLADLGAVRVAWPCSPSDPFFNVNAPEDLEILRARLMEEETQAR